MIGNTITFFLLMIFPQKDKQARHIMEILTANTIAFQV
jgi:hypothetical protein